MLLRREFAINASRASSGLCSTLVNTPICDAGPRPDECQHKGGRESKRRYHAWTQTRGILSQYAKARTQSPLARHYWSAGGVLSAKDTRGLRISAHNMGSFTTRYLRASTVDAQVQRKLALFMKRTFLSKHPRLNLTAETSSNTLIRKFRSCQPIPMGSWYRLEYKNIDESCERLMGVLEATVAMYPCRSLTNIHLYDVRDELLCSVQCIQLLLRQCSALYPSEKGLSSIGCGSEPRRFPSGETVYRKKILNYTSVITRRAFRDSRQLILHYARVIDRFYERRGVTGKLDSVFESIEHLYSTLMPPGEEIPHDSNVSRYPRLRALLAAVSHTKRTLFALQRRFRNFKQFDILWAPFTPYFTQSTVEFELSLNAMESWILPRVEAGDSHQSSHSKSVKQTLLTDVRGIRQNHHAAEKTRSGSNARVDDTTFLPYMDTPRSQGADLSMSSRRSCHEITEQVAGQVPLSETGANRQLVHLSKKNKTHYDTDKDKLTRLPSHADQDMDGMTPDVDAYHASSPSSSTQHSNLESASAQHVLGVFPMEQKLHECSMDARGSLMKLIDVICSTANHLSDTRRIVEIQLLELTLLTSGRRLIDEAYQTRVHLRYREAWDSVRGDLDTDRRFDILRRLLDSERRQAERAFSISLKAMFAGYLTLERYRDLYGLWSRTDRHKYYVKIMAPIAQSHKAIQAVLFLGEAGDRAHIRLAVKRLIDTHRYIQRYTCELFYDWSLMPSGQYVKPEARTPLLGAASKAFHLCWIDLAAHLEWLNRWLSGEYRRLTEEEKQDIKISVDAYARLHKPAAPRVQPDGSPVYLPVEGCEGHSSSSAKRLFRNSWPNNPSFQASIRSMHQNIGSTLRSRILRFHHSAIVKSQSSIWGQEARTPMTQSSLSRKPPRVFLEEDPRAQWPEYSKCRFHAFRVMQSVDDLVDALVNITSEGPRYKYKKRLLLYPMEFFHWKEQFSYDSYNTRRYIRLRECWDAAACGLEHRNQSARLQILHSLRQQEQNEVKLAFSRSLSAVYCKFLELEDFRHSFGPSTRTANSTRYHALLSPLAKSGNDIRRLAYRFFKREDEPGFVLKELHDSFAPIQRHVQRIVEGRLSPWFQHVVVSVVPVVCAINKDFKKSFARSFGELQILFASLSEETRGAIQHVSNNTSGASERHQLADQDLRSQADARATQIPLPVYAAVEESSIDGAEGFRRRNQSSEALDSQRNVPLTSHQHGRRDSRQQTMALHDVAGPDARPDVSVRIHCPARTEFQSHLRQPSDVERMRTLSFKVLGSLRRVIERLREPIRAEYVRAFGTPPLLYALEFQNWARYFEEESCHVRRYVRLREEWDIALGDPSADNASSQVVLLQQLQTLRKTEPFRMYCQSLDFVYQAYLELEECQRLHGLSTRSRLRRTYKILVEPLAKTGSELRLLYAGWVNQTDEEDSSWRLLLTSAASIILTSQKLIYGWLRSAGHYKRQSIISKHKMALCLHKFRRSRRDMTEAHRQYLNAIGQPVLISESGVGSPSQASPNTSPRHVPLMGKEADVDGEPVKHLHRKSWSKPRFQSGIAFSKLRRSRSTFDPRAASFHTSVAVRSPLAGTAAVTATATATATENQTKSEARTDQVDCVRQTNDRQSAGPLGYTLPLERLKESMIAPKTMGLMYWQYSLYEGPKGERVKVHYCKSLETTERISKLFLNEKVIGFDIEWKANATAKEGIRKNVATIQIASEERVALFHIARFSKGDSLQDLVAPTLKRIMESDSITKVGVSIKSDCTRLRNFMKIDSRGLFELSHLYKLVKYSNNDAKKINKKLVSLATQTEEHLMLPMYKDPSVRSSDWSEELNYQQISYAASDSYAGLQLYYTLNSKRLSLFPTPPLPAHADLNLPIRLANGQTVAEYEDPAAEEPPVDPSTDFLSPIENLAEGLMNVQIEDSEDSIPKPSPKFKRPRQPAVAVSSHPSIMAANEWIKRYRASVTPAVISPSDLSYPILPSTTSPSPPIPAPNATSSPTSSFPTPSPPSSSTATANPTSINCPPPPPQRPRATPSPLRAYFLFHHHQLTVPDIAALLRTPPLQLQTVAQYVLDAVKLEGLDMRRERLEECMVHLGSEGRGRYGGVARRLEGDG